MKRHWIFRKDLKSRKQKSLDNSRLLAVFIVGFWLIMMTLLAAREFVPATISPSEIKFPENLKESWHIYTNGQKIGYLLFDKTESLWNFSMEVNFLDYHILIEGRTAGDKIFLSCKGPVSREIVLPWSSKNDIINGLFPGFYKRGLKVGDKRKWWVLNPLTGQRELVRLNVEGAAYSLWDGDFIPVLTAKLRYSDIDIELWLDETGNPIKINTPWGWEFVKDIPLS